MIEGKNVKNGNVKCMRKKVFSEDEERKKEIRCQKVQNNNKFKGNAIRDIRMSKKTPILHIQSVKRPNPKI